MMRIDNRLSARREEGASLSLFAPCFPGSLKRVLSFTPLLWMCDHLFCYFYILAKAKRLSKTRMIRALYL